MPPIQQFLHYLPIASYALCRTEILVSAIKVVNEYSDVKIRALGELIFEIFFALAGGVAYLPIPFWIRGSFPKRPLTIIPPDLYDIYPYPYEMLDQICKQITNALDKPEYIKVLNPHSLFLAYRNIKAVPKITTFQFTTLPRFKRVFRLFIYRFFPKIPTISFQGDFDFKLQLLRSMFATVSSPPS